MDRTMKYMGQCPEDMMPSPAEVPIGWQRRLHQGGVVYISPSGSVLACLEQAKSYLLTDGTCKCGLECPLILHKVFNFDPGAVVRQRTAEDVRADADVTKLCIHKRKIIAVATLHKSMESQLPGAAAGRGHGGALNYQAIRNEMHNGLSNSVTPDSKNPYKMTGQQHYQHDLGSPPPPRDPYTAAAAQNRSRLCGAAAARRSPFSGRHGGLLSPPSSTSCGSQQHYGDGTPSPRPDSSLRSPDASSSSVLAFHGALSPGSAAHMNGERFTPLSPPGIVVHGSPPGAQPPPCAMTARTGGGVSLSPSLNTKSPGRQKSPCNFNAPIADYQLKVSSACHAQQQHPHPHPHPPALPQLPPCVVQKKQVTPSEKDPLGILDPIPSKTHRVQDQIVSPPLSSHLQFNTQPQVPSVNVNIPPPAIVPLPSNLPLPTVKPGTIGHGLRLQHVNPPVSPSPITSPPLAHMAAGPALIRAEEKSHHSQHASSSSVPFAQHGSCSALAAGPQVVSGLHSRSPRPTVPLHHLKEPRNAGPPPQQVSGVSDGQVRGPPPDSHRLLNPQNPSFPASSLLSAAAKAQLVNQNKLTDSLPEGQPSGLGPPGLMGGGGGEQMYMDGGGGGGGGGGFAVSGPGLLTAAREGQSGRAALRDKLMSQQREALRKRKQQADDEVGGGGGSDVPFNMNAQRVGSNASSSCYPEPMKRMLQQQGGGGLQSSSSTPMAHLLQSMSHQSAQNGLHHAGHHHHHNARSGKSPFFEENVAAAPPMSMPRSSHHSVPAGFQDLSNKRNLNPGAPPPPPPLGMEQFADPMGQMYDPGYGGNAGAAVGYGGHKAMGSMDNLNPQRQQQQLGPPYSKPFQGNPPFRERTVLPSVVTNGGFHTFSESGAPHK